MRKFSILAALLALPLFGCGGGGTGPSTGNVGQNSRQSIVGSWRQWKFTGNGKEVIAPGTLILPNGNFPFLNVVRWTFNPSNASGAGTVLEYGGGPYDYHWTSDTTMYLRSGNVIATVDGDILTITFESEPTYKTLYTRE